MNRFTRLLVCTLLLVGCEKGCHEQPFEPEPRPTSEIRVYSWPSGAEIFFDGVPTHTVTPDTLVDVPIGSHEVRVQKYGYQDASDTVTFTEYSLSPKFVDFDLIPMPVDLTVTSSPSGALVLLNHETTGQTTPATFSGYAGDTVFVRCMHEGRFPMERTLFVLGDSNRIHLDLPPITTERTIVYLQNDTYYSVGLDGMNPSFIVSTIGRGAVDWSPKGQYFATMDANEVLTVYDRSGTPLVSHETLGGRSSDFSWSPDGNHLAHGRYGYGIYTCDVAGGEGFIQRTSGGGTYHHNPVYSPDGTQIAFIQHAWESKAWILLMSADGGGAWGVSEQLPRTAYDEYLNLRWVLPTELLFTIHENGIYTFTIGTPSPTQVITDRIYWMKISPDRAMYVYEVFGDGQDRVFYGAVGDWVSSVFSRSRSFYTVLWSPGNEAFAITEDSSVFWVFLDGVSYRIVDRDGTHWAYLSTIVD